MDDWIRLPCLQAKRAYYKRIAALHTDKVVQMAAAAVKARGGEFTSQNFARVSEETKEAQQKVNDLYAVYVKSRCEGGGTSAPPQRSPQRPPPQRSPQRPPPQRSPQRPPPQRSPQRPPPPPPPPPRRPGPSFMFTGAGAPRAPPRQPTRPFFWAFGTGSRGTKPKAPSAKPATGFKFVPREDPAAFWKSKPAAQAPKRRRSGWYGLSASDYESDSESPPRTRARPSGRYGLF